MNITAPALDYLPHRLCGWGAPPSWFVVFQVPGIIVPGRGQSLSMPPVSAVCGAWLGLEQLELLKPAGSTIVPPRIVLLPLLPSPLPPRPRTAQRHPSDCTLGRGDMALDVMQLHAHSTVPHLITFLGSGCLYIQTTDNEEARKHLPACSLCFLQQQRQGWALPATELTRGNGSLPKPLHPC